MTSPLKSEKIHRMGKAVEGQRSSTPSWLPSLLIFLFPCLATATRFGNGFVFDDVFVIQRGTFIHDLANLPRAFTEHTMVASSLNEAVGKPAMDTYRPLSIASFFWDAALSGHEPWSYHLTNMLLHGLVCVLVLQLANVLLPQAPLRTRFLAVLCFALAPWPAEAYVFINGRSDLFLALFSVAALLLQRRALDESRLLFACLSGLSVLLALLSKEVAVVALPLLVLVPTQQPAGAKKRALAALPCVASLALYLGMRAYALTGLRTHSDGSQLLIALRNLPVLLLDGLAHSVAPTPYFLRSLRDDYATLPSAIFVIAGVVMVCVVGLALWFWKRSYVITWALALAMATLAPVAMISTVHWPGFGRYLYLSSIALSLAFAAALDAVASLKPRLAGLVRWFPVLLATCSFALLFDMTLGFGSEQQVYARTLEHVPHQAWSHGFLGMAIKRDGRCKEAVPHLQRAAQMDPNDARYPVHLARCLAELGATQAALVVAGQGAAHFRNTRQEAGFLVIEAALIAPTQPFQAKTKLQRCLALDKRKDCADLLQLLTQRGF